MKKRKPSLTVDPDTRAFGRRGARPDRKRFTKVPEAGHTVLRLPRAKKMVSIRLDEDVVDWYKEEGPGYQTRMHAVLKAYMEASRETDLKSPKRSVLQGTGTGGTGADAPSPVLRAADRNGALSRHNAGATAHAASAVRRRS